VPYVHLQDLQLSNSTWAQRDISKGLTAQAKGLIDVSHGQGILDGLMSKMQS
jgi:hypothetical protein